MPAGRTVFEMVFRRHVTRRAVDLGSSVLILGGSAGDVESLREIGFTDMTLSNIEGGTPELDPELGVRVIAADAEALDLPDDSYDILFCHAVLHHCRSPHRALCEMLRVSRKHVVILEPNDSLGMRLLTRLGLSYPYEIPAVVANDYRLGGVRNTAVPNFIYRWNEDEIVKTVSAFLAEYEVSVAADPYWDFEVDEAELGRRTQTSIPKLVRLVGGPRRLLRILAYAQSALNGGQPIRVQGNKFFCWIEKTPRLKPWLTRSESGDVVFNRQYGE